MSYYYSGRENFTSVSISGSERAFMEGNISAPWPASGLFPFDPTRLFCGGGSIIVAAKD